MATTVMDEVLCRRDPTLAAAVAHARDGHPDLALRTLGEGVQETGRETLGEGAGRIWLALPDAARAETAVLAPTHDYRPHLDAMPGARNRIARALRSVHRALQPGRAQALADADCILPCRERVVEGDCIRWKMHPRASLRWRIDGDTPRLDCEPPTVRDLPALSRKEHEGVCRIRTGRAGCEADFPLVCSHPTVSVARTVIGVESLMARGHP